MTEADVALTDYLLSVESAIFVFLLIRAETGRPKLKAPFLLLFGALSVAAVLGGTVHGFFPSGASFASQILWRLTMISIGIVALGAWLVGFELLFPGKNNFLRKIALLEFGIYSVLILFFSQSFFLAIVNYLPATFFVLVSLVIYYKRTKNRALLSGVYGILLTFLAAGIQQLGHNAIYHIVQAAGILLLYVAAASLVKEKALRSVR